MDRKPSIAIVTDCMTQRGGAERCVEAIAAIYPDAPIFSLLYSPEAGPPSLAGRVTSSWLSRLPGAARHHRALLPLFPHAVESFDLDGFDVIISSHHTAAKGVIRGAAQLHICYCHTPMRALWERPHAELRRLSPPGRLAARYVFHRLRLWDYAASARVDHYVANSRVTQRRIARHYGRGSEVIHPPIDVERFTPGGRVDDYYLVACRDVPYKRTEIAVAAARLAGRRLIVAGGTPHRGTRSRDVEHVGHVSDSELVRLMRGARALLLPQIEDFGMTALEMNACGRPVIALAAGGALETVVDGTTGLLVPEQSAEAFASAIAQLERTTFDGATLRAHAERFSKDRFMATFAAHVAALVNAVPSKRRVATMRSAKAVVLPAQLVG